MKCIHMNNESINTCTPEKIHGFTNPTSAKLSVHSRVVMNEGTYPYIVYEGKSIMILHTLYLRGKPDPHDTYT